MLSNEIQKGESKILEFKEMFPISENLIKTVIAFSNTAGGQIIIGINDDREVVEVDENIIFDMSGRISSFIYNSCSTSIIPEIYN